MSNGLDKLAEATASAIKLAPELYNDVLQPAAQETGRIIARVPRAINAALSRLDQWILSRDYNIDETKKLLAIKLENVAPEKIVTPDAYVAIPALQAISYTMDSEELRNLYANLLAKSMNIDTKSTVHPSFVEIIKQMSPFDSLVLNHIAKLNKVPLVSLAISTTESNTSRKRLIKNITDFSFSSAKLISISIDNLKRLGLIDITESRKLVDDTKYNSIYKSKHYELARKHLRKAIDSENGEKIVYYKYFLQKTSLGQEFVKICIND